MSLVIDVKQEDEKVSVALNGNITALTAGDFEKAVADHIDGVKLLEIDFRNCTYISSAGLRVLTKAYHILNDNGGKVRLVNVGEFVMEVLQTTYLDEIFEIETGA